MVPSHVAYEAVRAEGADVGESEASPPTRAGPVCFGVFVFLLLGASAADKPWHWPVTLYWAALRVADSVRQATPDATAGTRLRPLASGCSWRPARPAWYCRSATEASSRTFEGDPEAAAWYCTDRAEAYACAEGTFRAIVAGPFVSRPGEWHSIALDYSSLLGAADRVVAYVGDALDAGSRPVPFPPLHLHHLHVMRGLASHWYETHGDYPMDPVEGYERRLPRGYCDASRAGGRRILLTQINGALARAARGRGTGTP